VSWIIKAIDYLSGDCGPQFEDILADTTAKLAEAERYLAGRVQK
jgi:hypothetical protein